MLNKKNIAMTMAAATAFTAVAPVAQSFAAVVDTTQEQEIKELKADVLAKFNTKYTKNQVLKGDQEGECAYKITMTIGNNAPVPMSNYAEFERKFDEAFAKLHNGERIVVNYTTFDEENEDTDNGVRILEDGTVVDFKDATITVNEGTTLIDEVKSNYNVDNEKHIINILGGLVKGELEDGTQYVKVPTSNGYITLKEGDVKLNLDAPILKVENGNYVNAEGHAIKAFNEETVKDDAKSVFNKGGVVEGYYQEKGMSASTDKGVIAIVKKATSLEKEDVTVADLYEASTDRLTQKGNELRKTLLSTVDKKDVTDESKVKSVKSVYGIDKAGEKLDLESDDLDNLAEIKVLFEERENTISEWVPVKEITITALRNNPLSIVIDHVIDNKSMVDGMDLVAGLDRYETSVELSKKGWKDGADTVVLVSGASDKLVDGLTATPLAAQQDAPVLLTKKDTLPAEVIEEIERLEASKVYIVGGESAVSKDIETLLKTKYSLDVTRLAGNSRYETSNVVAEELLSKKDEKFEQIFVVGGKGEADALSVSAIAGKKETPILLTPANELSKDVESFIKANVSDDNNKTDIFVVGGDSSVSKNVQSQLATIAGTEFEIERLAGEGRQETNALVIDKFADQLTKVVVGKSNNAALVDSLSAGAYAAKTKSHIVLATNELTESQEDALNKVTLNQAASDLTQDNSNKSKVQAGYGIAEKVAKFIKGLELSK